MSHYPTPGEYQEALQFPEVAFVDPVLQAARPEVNALGLPVAVTGAFAAVFPVDTPAGRLALKCFLSHVPDQQARYRAIARYLEKVDLPFSVPFAYEPEGIRVEGRLLPLLKMEWAEGEGLNRFVARHLSEPHVLAGLAEQWAAMLARLEDHAVAHGDLQHGNVLVAEEGGACRLKLVDYDTMYVPALRGRRSPEVGHRSYQHPDRGEEDFGPYLDRFSGLAVYLALRACIVEPALWTRYDTGENLLFRAADFYDPAQSALFEELSRMDGLEPLVEALRTACYLEPPAVPALAEVLRGRSAVQGAAVRQRVRARKEGRRAAVRRSRFERLAAPGVLIWTAVVAGLFGTGWMLPGLAVLLAGLAAGGWTAWHHYRRLAAVRRRRRLRQEAAFFERMRTVLQRQVETLERDRAQLLESLDRLKAERLRRMQEQVLEDRLKYHFVGEASAFEGVSHKVVVRLKAAGIRTAYQATPERLAGVRGIADASRACVSMWRAALVAQYRAALPTQLSPAEARRLERYVERRVAGLDAEAERVREKVRVQEAEQHQVLARRQAVPRITFGHYLRYLLRLDALPAMKVEGA